METTNRYSDKELLEFKKIILDKISKAKNDLELLKSAYMNDGNNGTDDTAPTFKAFEEALKLCLKKRTLNLLLDKKSLLGI